MNYRSAFRTFMTVWLGLVLASGIRPVNPVVWALENIAVLAAACWLIWTRKSVPLSVPSYVCITIFLMLHEMGAHYTYMRVPIGAFVQAHFGWPRNDYDRVVHFAFGLLITVPLREMVVRVMKAPAWFTYVFPALLTMTLSALYEILEARVIAAAPDAAAAVFLAMQGDLLDSQWDMAWAMIGAILSMLFLRLFTRREGSR